MRVRHWAVPALTFAALTAWWLLPVLSNPSAVIPGAGAGDNVTFVWNVWWMRYVLHHPGHTFFFTSFLFHPAGVDLTLHTHTALPALIGAVSSSPIAGQNAVIALHLYLNFLCSYALAYRLTHRVVPALAAAMIFGTSSFVCAHLNGHFNLIAAWTLPLVCWLTLRALEKTSWTAGAVVGLALAATAYTDYYLFVYAVLIVGLLWISPALTLSARREPSSPGADRLRRFLLVVVMSLLLVDLLVVIAILLIRSDHLDIGPIHVSVRSVRNPITGAWMLLLGVGAIWLSAKARLHLRWDVPRRTWAVPVTAIATSLLLVMPLLIHAASLWRAGSYVSQAYLWRSGPGGVDAATFLLGNPFHAVWGERVRVFYARFHIDVIESGSWIPLSAIAFTIAAIVLRRGSALWLRIGTVFLVWALGPWLTLFGRQTPVILPAMLVRFVPVMANARIPGRAMVVVYLAIAMLAAIGFDRMTCRGRGARAMAWCLVLLLVIECVPSRPPLYAPDRLSNYVALRAAGSNGAVCELPIGLRDGFGETGSLDEAVLLHQMIHERPIVGGFVARLPPAIATTYEKLPVIRSLLRLSSGGAASEQDLTLTRAEAAAALASAGIAFVVLDTRRASASLIDYVQSRIELRRMAEEDGRVFYEVM